MKAAAGPMLAKAKAELEKVKEKIQAQASTLKPKLEAAMKNAEPQVKEFMKSPSAEYLKKNPRVMAASLGLLATAGVPGAGSLKGLVGLGLDVEAVAPLLMMVAGPAAAIL